MPCPSPWASLLSKAQRAQLQHLQAILPQDSLPPRSHWFKALESLTPDQVRVVVLGQDPYHGVGQAEGLSFSVAQGPWPPSLQNIFKEMCNDLGCQPPFMGSLLPWAQQGVLLLNRVLTVAPGQAGSHQGLGWEDITAQWIQAMNDSSPKAFWLWGKEAGSLAPQLDQEKHLVLCAPHPSPLSSWRGFFGSKPFSKTNQWLVDQGQAPIDFACV
mgnify:CR=1 FL=1